MDEKEILRMIDLQKNHCESQRIGDCVDKDCNDCSARVFYNAGYRKESDTARQIIEWIKRNGTLGYGGYVVHDSTIEQICKKYGVDLGDSNE
jgi:hypothetical protein